MEVNWVTHIPGCPKKFNEAMDVNWVTHIPGCPKKFNEARTTFFGKSLKTILSKVFPEIIGVNVA